MVTTQIVYIFYRIVGNRQNTLSPLRVTCAIENEKNYENYTAM